MANDSGDLDPRWIADQDNWHSWDVGKLRTMFNQIDTEALYTHADDWRKAGTQLSQTVGNFVNELRTAIAGWSGDTAAKVHELLDKIDTWHPPAGQAVSGVGDAVHMAAEAVTAVKPQIEHLAQVASTPVFEPVVKGPTSGTVVEPAHVQQQWSARQSANEQAQRLMRTTYTTAYHRADGSVPTFPSLPGVGSQGSGPAPGPVSTTTSGFVGPSASGGISHGAPSYSGVGSPQPGVAYGSGAVSSGIAGGGVGTSSPAPAQAVERGAAMPMGAMPGRANRDEDAEHRKPDYLVERDDVFGFGSDDRTIAPPVIGEQ